MTVKRTARLSAFTALAFLLGRSAPAEDWPAWRGPGGQGISREPSAPVRFGPSRDLVFRVATPGTGHSSPVVLGDALFLTAATGDGKDQARVIIRYDARDGSKVWEREVVRARLEEKHRKNSYASGTPATDGERVYAAFLAAGRVEVAALGLDGSPRWRVSPAGFRSMHGFCSSPVLYRDMVIVNCDQDSPEAVLVALAKGTGEESWRTVRENGIRSYVTPLIVEAAGRDQLLISGQKTVAAYDPAGGRRLWFCEGPTDQCVASPVFGNGLVFITGGFPDRHILAIRPDGKGDVTASRIVWRSTKGVAYVPSPLLVGGYFYVVHDETGVASCFEAATGKLAWQERLGGSFSSSLTYAAGNIYAGSEEGAVHVFAAAPRFERVALNDLGEPIFASPAFSNGRLYLRTTKALYCFGAPAPGPAGSAPLATAVPAVPTSQMAFPGKSWEEASPASQEVDARKLDAAVDHLKAHAGKDGVRELVIVRNGRLIWKGEDVDRVHGIWSCTKSFTSTVLGLLIDDGKCTLDFQVSRAMSELAPHYPDATLRHFTTMTSGYRAVGDEPKGSYRHGPSSTPFTPSPEPLFEPPGSRYAYWDSAMNLLGLALTRIAGEPLEDLFRRRIAEPIGMDPEKWDWGDLSADRGLVVNGGSGNGGKHVIISAREMARFGHLFLSEGRWDGRQLLSRDWLQQATSVQVASSIPWAQPESKIDGRGCYGFNWWRNGEKADGRTKWPGAPPGTFAALGYNNNACFVIPEWRMVIVRLGLDEDDHKITDEEWGDFLRQVGAAIQKDRSPADPPAPATGGR